MRNRLNQESHIRTCQEIQELRTCCEETDRARQAGIDELSVPQKEGFSNCESTIDSKSGFTEQGEFIVSWEFQDETASSSGASHVPSQPPFRVPEECPAAILDCRMIHRMSWALQETFLKAYLFEKDHPQLSKIQGIWYLLASTPGPRFQREAGILRHTGGTYSHNGMMDFSSRKCILENSQTLWNFKAGKSTSRLKYAQKNSRSEANRFFRLRYAWWNDASALKKLLDKHVQFRRRISVEEQHAQKYDRFSWGMQIASMIYEHFRSAWACEAVQGLSDFINIRLENDDFQDFDVRWDQAPLSVSETPSYVILEGLYKSKLQDSLQLQTVLALCEQENVRNNGQPSYSRLKTSVRLHIVQTMWGFSHDPASGNECEAHTAKGQSSSPAPTSKAKTEGEIPSKSSGNREESRQTKVADSRADIENVITRHVIFGSLPCVSIANLNQDTQMATNADSDTLRLMGSPARSQRKVRPSLRRGHKRKFCTKKDAPAEQHGTCRKIFTSSRVRRKLRFTLLLKSRRLGRKFQNPQRNETSWLMLQSINAHAHPKRICAQKTWKLSEDPRNPTTVVTANVKMQNKRGSTSIFTILASSWLCNYSKNTLAVSIAEKTLRRTRILFWVGQRSKTTVDQTREEYYLENGQFRTSCCSRVVIQFWYQFVINIDTAGLVKYIFSPATERCDEPAPQTKITRGMAIEIRTTVCETFLNGWRSSQTIWRTQKCSCPHTFLRTQIRSYDSGIRINQA